MIADDTALVICGQAIAPGARTTLELPLPPLYTHTPLTMPMHVIRGKRPGPRLFVSAAIHGDELNGVEIIRRLLARRDLNHLRGTLITIPIVNVYGVIHNVRYMPDRRDLNRCFPGSARGSMTGRVAALFMSEIVSNCSHGLDLHTGAVHRENMPQVRANLADDKMLDLANAFGVPVVIDAPLREGSLRSAAQAHDVPVLVYEAGEALRFNEHAIRVGLEGVVNVMRTLGMLRASRRQRKTDPFVAHSTSWVRAPQSGILRATAQLGARVEKGRLLGAVADPLGGSEIPVSSHLSGVVIGRRTTPLVHEGEALFHIASFEDLDAVEDHLSQLDEDSLLRSDGEQEQEQYGT